MRLFAAAALVFLQGCSTFATVAGGIKPEDFRCDPDYTIPRIYSGVANDFRFIGGKYSDKGFAIWDLPFSLIADTLFLPYTIYAQARYGNLCNKVEDKSESAPSSAFPPDTFSQRCA